MDIVPSTWEEIERESGLIKAAPKSAEVFELEGRYNSFFSLNEEGIQEAQQLVRRIGEHIEWIYGTVKGLEVIEKDPNEQNKRSYGALIIAGTYENLHATLAFTGKRVSRETSLRDGIIQTTPLPGFDIGLDARLSVNVSEEDSETLYEQIGKEFTVIRGEFYTPERSIEVTPAASLGLEGPIVQ
ncbi:MAG: hypothetical protein OXR66_03490 [Candidatus Woesearchaeota archaeon]|nr:hypothetical protein [Candidatus Woesearchaeota archaeon]